MFDSPIALILLGISAMMNSNTAGARSSDSDNDRHR